MLEPLTPDIFLYLKYDWFTMNPSIIVRDIAEQHCSLFNVEAFGINNNGQVIENNVSKLN